MDAPWVDYYILFMTVSTVFWYVAAGYVYWAEGRAMGAW